MSDAMNMTVSGIFNKNGKKVISVLFSDGSRSAEGTIPEGKIHINQGFSEEEIAALEFYLKTEQDSIVEMAKKVNVMKAFMGDEVHGKSVKGASQKKRTAGRKERRQR